MPVLPEKIKEARASKKLSQGALSALLAMNLKKPYIAPQTVSNWELGKTTPLGKMLDALVEVTGFPHSFFYGESDSKPLTRKRKAAAA